MFIMHEISHSCEPYSIIWPHIWPIDLFVLSLQAETWGKGKNKIIQIYNNKRENTGEWKWKINGWVK